MRRLYLVMTLLAVAAGIALGNATVASMRLPDPAPSLGSFHDAGMADIAPDGTDSSLS